jgi:hypothetical protein
MKLFCLFMLIWAVVGLVLILTVDLPIPKNYKQLLFQLFLYGPFFIMSYFYVLSFDLLKSLPEKLINKIHKIHDSLE